MTTNKNAQQIAIVVGLVFNEEGNLLIAKRIDKTFPEADGKWEFVGGKIEFGEDPEQAIRREVLEETGLEVQIKRLLPKVLTNLWTNKDGEDVQVIILSYECRVAGGELDAPPKDPKIAELKFIPLSDLERYDVMKNVKEIACLLSL